MTDNIEGEVPPPVTAPRSRRNGRGAVALGTEY